MIRRPPRSTQGVSSAASDVYKRQVDDCTEGANLSGTFNGSNGTGLSESTTYYLEIEQQATSSAPKTTTYNITVAAEGN